MQGGARCAERGVHRVRRSERASAPTPQMDSFQQPARPGEGATRAGGTVDRLDGGGTGSHGAGRLRTQPRRFVFSARRAAVREGVLVGGGPEKVGRNFTQTRKAVWSLRPPRTPCQGIGESAETERVACPVSLEERTCQPTT